MPKNRAKNFKREFSSGAVIFRETGDTREYLLLCYAPIEKDKLPKKAKIDERKSGIKKNFWGFPKGLVEKGESMEDGARREIREETSLDNLNFVPGFKHKIHYFFRYDDTLVSKDVVYFLAKAPENAKIKISWEHAGYKWLPYKEAMEFLNHKNHREVLEAAENFLNSNN